jgi:hypothetical protein
VRELALMAKKSLASSLPDTKSGDWLSAQNRILGICFEPQHKTGQQSVV